MASTETSSPSSSSSSSSSSSPTVNIEDVVAAYARIRKLINRTPVLTCSTMDSFASPSSSSSLPSARSVFFKCELFQKSGSFKARGACNAVAMLCSPDGAAAAKGVCTHSSGNHAGALALAAKLRGIPATIVMPSNAPAIKKAAVEGYGATIVTCAPTQAAREAAAAEVASTTGAEFIHPSEDVRVIAGQGTMALELFQQVAETLFFQLEEGQEAKGNGGGAVTASTKEILLRLQEASKCTDKTILSIDWKNLLSTNLSSTSATTATSPPSPSSPPLLDAVIVPIGGGGMAGGVATVIKALDSRILVIAAEPAAADDAARSKAAGSIQKNDSPPQTIADGLKTTLGPNTWPLVRDRIDQVMCVTEEEIASAMKLVYERMKLAIEPSAAVGVAVLLSKQFKDLPNIGRVGVILCGGNVDLKELPF